MRWVVSLLIALACCPATMAVSAEAYPAVRALQRTLEVPDVSRADVVLDIRSIDGAPVYRLQCHSAGYLGDPNFDYSGDFECRLSPIESPDAFSTLLTEDPNQSRDWESRGRFFAAQLREPCAAVPQFGASRTFRLRGMSLDLQIKDPVFDRSGKLRSLRLVVSVRPDPLARRPIAEAVALPKDAPPECRLEEMFVDPATFSADRPN